MSVGSLCFPVILVEGCGSERNTRIFEIVSHTAEVFRFMPESLLYVTELLPLLFLLLCR